MEIAPPPADPWHTSPMMVEQMMMQQRQQQMQHQQQRNPLVHQQQQARAPTNPINSSHVATNPQYFEYIIPANVPPGSRVEIEVNGQWVYANIPNRAVPGTILKIEIPRSSSCHGKTAQI